MLIIIAIFAGSSAAIVLYLIQRLLAKYKLDKKIREKYNDVSAIRQKGITGNIFFIAEKIGKHLKRYNIKQLSLLCQKVQLNLIILGKPYSQIDAYTFSGIQFLFGIAAILISIMILNIFNPVFLAVIAGASFFMPYFIIKDKVKAKHKAIFRQLPDILDLLTLMVEAGLDFNAAMNKLLSLEKGVLIDEFNLVQQEIKLGASKIAAFENMSNRIQYMPLNTVVNSLILSFKTGSSLAATLRTLSEQFRVERMQLAEKMAAQAPIKLMGPLVLLIFPTVFIVLFGPILLSFIGSK